MYYQIRNNTIIASWPSNVKSVYIADADVHVFPDVFENYGIYKETTQSVELAPDEYIFNYELEVIDGRPVRVPIMHKKTQEMLFSEIETLRRAIIEERERRLAAGFDFDFGDERGVHRIGTTEQDHKGWDDVTKLSTAAILGGGPNTPIDIVTDTGPVQITATEWQQIIVAAGQFGQPIWAASFALQAMDPIPENYQDDSYWLPS